MNCICGDDLEEVGGIQMKGCHHFLCTNCLISVAESTTEPEIKCFNCTGFLRIEDLDFMIPDEVYANLIARVSENASYEAGNEIEEKLEEQGAAALQLSDYSVPKSEEDDAYEEPQDLHSPPEDIKENGWAQKQLIMTELMTTYNWSASKAANFIDALPILENLKPISCKICMDDEIGDGDGVILKDCLHIFCKDCLAGHIRASETAQVKCPFIEDGYNCDEVLKPREIKALVSEEEYRRHSEDLSLREAEKILQNVFHCLTPDCGGFCEGTSGLFKCPICSARNCLACKAIHSGTCAQHWAALEAEEKRLRELKEDEDNRLVQRRNDELSVEEINKRVSGRIWMRCPKCSVVIEKFQGCAHMKCRNCNHDFNWTGLPA